VIDPKTGLPLTPAELREKEIDKFDPMKRDYDFTGAANANAAQTDQQQQQSQQPSGQPQSSADKPLPGSVAAMNADAAATGKSQSSGSSAGGGGGGGGGGGDSDYTGPAVLSRSYTLARPMSSREVKWTAGLSFSYSWDDGQEPVATTGQNVGYQNVTSSSSSVSWYVSGRHAWKRDQLGLSYSGGYSGYLNNSNLSGINHALSLDYSHVVSSRITLSLVESGSEYSQNYTLENPVLEPGASIANLDLAASPTTELVTGVTRQSSTQASMTYHQTARLSYNLSGSYFITGRTQGVGMWGHQASGDVNYRLTAKATVGGYYSFTNYDYSHGVASSDSHSVGGIFSYAFGRRMQLQTRLGATRIESLAYSAVPLPLQLAAILGQATTIVNGYSLHWTSDISAQLVRDLGRNKTATIAYAHGESPGNGVLLTSVQQSISAGFSTALLRRRLPLSVGFSRSQLDSTSLAQITSSRSDTYYFSTSRPIGRSISGTFRFDHTSYLVSGTALSGGDYRVSIGLSWGVPENVMRKL
jgi:hypothetical protein